MMRSISLTLALFVLPTFACDRGPSAPRPAEPRTGVLAMVNGTAITEADVAIHDVRRKSEDDEAPPPLAPELKKKIVETMIGQEILAQRAVELGLDATEPSYQAGLKKLEAQLADFKRRELSDIFIKREVVGKADVSEAEAKAYFEQNASRIRTEIRVQQILLRDEAAIEQAHRDITAGAPFEQVAARPFPNLPETVQKPWELGWLKWNQLPKPWQEVVPTLQKGQVSGVIKGPNGRNWIIKVLDMREDPNVTFESVAPQIINALKANKVEELRARTERDLRAAAQVQYMPALNAP